MPAPVIRLAISNDYSIVVAGLREMLKPFQDRVTIVETLVGEPAGHECDIVLYDTFGAPELDQAGVEALLKEARAQRLVVYSWRIEEAFEHRIEAVSGYLSKTLSSEEIVEAIEAVQRGARVVRTDSASGTKAHVGAYPGDTEGLSERESEVLALIVRGLSNNEIAQQAFLSINTIKSYIRSAYRTMGVTSRSQAVLWGIDHGFRPERSKRPVA
jgi:NarL family two-component system response regulator LiaR